MIKDNSGMIFTGERLVTEIYEYWTIEHLHRYAIALNLVTNKKVIDIASGEGYGANLLSNIARQVIGVDISSEAIDHANKKYKKSNLSFIQGAATQIPVEDNSLDVVISFETIEHHSEHDKMLQEIKRVLKIDGILIISSPDKRNYSDIPKYKNPFHIKELYDYEFYGLINTYFSNVLELNQKTIFGSIIGVAKAVDRGFIEFSGSFSNVTQNKAVQSPIYNICIASNSPLNNLPIIEHSVFANEDIFQMYKLLKDENNRLINSNTLLNRKLSRPTHKLVDILEFPFKLLKNFIKK